MGRFVRTIGGDVPTGTIRRILPHEHGFLAVNRETPAEQKNLESVIERRLVREFRALVKQGVNLFVEVSTANSERQPLMWLRAGRRVGMHIVASTGFYVEDVLPRWVKKGRVDEIARFLEREVMEGIHGSGCRAGVIKVSSNSYGVEPGERKVFLAAARVHRDTGVPITTHSPKGALPHLALLEKHGVPPERVSVGHIEVNPWEDVLTAAKKGAMLIFTNWGGKEWVPEDMIAAQVHDLVRRGFLKHVMLSIDMYLYMKRGRLTLRWAGGYRQLIERVAPKLLRQGLKASQVERMLHDNPLRHLALA